MAIFDNLPFFAQKCQKSVSEHFPIPLPSKNPTKYGKCLNFPYFVKSYQKKSLLCRINIVGQLPFDKFPDFVEFKAVLGTDFT